jgi:pimeloyl-ACP methyl ester carboxylesterase
MRLEVEKMTGLVLPESLPFEAPTIRRFAQAINECSGAPASVLTEWSEGEGRPTFFFCHGDFRSGGHYVRRLAELLKGTTRLISVAPHGLGGETIPPSIEQMASQRLPLILAAQPGGPFRLGGHCNGGAVAFELAHLLQMAGHHVEFLAIIDTPTMNAGGAMRRLGRGLSAALRFTVHDVTKRERLIATGMEFLWWKCERRRFWQVPLRERVGRIAVRLRSPRSGSFRQWIIEHPPPFREFYRAIASYLPRPLKVPIVFYSADHSGHYLKEICPQLEVLKVPGDHLGCITTHIHIVADDLRKRLSGYLADQS